MIYLYVKQHNQTGLKYLGKTTQDPFKYKGSGLHWSRHIEKHGYDVTTDILYYTPSKEDFKQVALHFSKKWNIVESKEWANLKPENGDGGGVKGQVPVKDKDSNTFLVSVDDPRYLSGELVHIRTGQVPVKDEDGNTSSVSKDDPRYLSGELVSISTGLVPVKDKDGNAKIVPVDDPRYLSGELVHISTGQITVKDKGGNTFNVSKGDPRYLSGELVHISKGSKLSEETKVKMSDIKNDSTWQATTGADSTKAQLATKFGHRRIGFNGIEPVTTASELHEVMLTEFGIAPSHASIVRLVRVNFDKEITASAIRQSPFLKELFQDSVGKTWAELGFYCN